MCVVNLTRIHQIARKLAAPRRSYGGDARHEFKEDAAAPMGFPVDVPRGTGMGNASAVPALEKRGREARNAPGG